MSPPAPSPSGPPRLAAVILAAGASTRMGSGNKLLAELGGRPVIAHVVAAALASRADPTVVVVGDRADDVRARTPDDVTIVENPRHASGLASSLAAGIRALPDDVDGCVVMLGDMPEVRGEDLDALAGAFDPAAPCVPVVDRRWGNPVLWPRVFFDELVELEGDRGARRILERDDTNVVEVPLENPGLLLDIDTDQDLQRTRARRHASCRA